MSYPDDASLARANPRLQLRASCVYLLRHDPLHDLEPADCAVSEYHLPTIKRGTHSNASFMSRPRILVQAGERKGTTVVLREIAHQWFHNQHFRVIECRCDCGTIHTQRLTIWRYRPALSCGCLKYKNPYFTHHKSRDAIYQVWKRMRQRCSKPSDKNYQNYGGRGIKVCDRWLKFENFYADMGDPPPGLSIDRIDNDGNYEPGNCRWATTREQANNTRKNSVHSAFGRTMTVTEWARVFDLRPETVFGRLRRGWPIEMAITTRPIRYVFPDGTKTTVRPECKVLEVA